MTAGSSLSVVVERPTDAQLLRAILGQELAGNLRFFATGGRISLATVGRNLLVHEGGPVLLVMDSNTTNQHLVDEMKAMASLAVRGVAPPDFSGFSEWVKVFAFVPEIEVIFFEAPQSLEIILGKEVPADKVQEGLLAPKAMLARVLDEGKVNYQALVTSMSAQAASLLATGRQALAVKEIVESMITPAVKA
jgi:hypothetical protein